jgi:hypothetical protein
VSLEEILKFLDERENENMTYHNPWDTAKAVLRGKFIAMRAYIKKIRELRTITSDAPEDLRKTRTSQT